MQNRLSYHLIFLRFEVYNTPFYYAANNIPSMTHTNIFRCNMNTINMLHDIYFRYTPVILRFYVKSLTLKQRLVLIF